MKFEEFPLAWRWTDSLHAVLPRAVLLQLQPMEPHDAQRAFERARVLRLRVQDPRVAHSADITAAEGRDWLREQHGGLHDTVIIVWSSDCALRTTWEIFTDYWSDFCYAASDDVSIWPESELWALFYYHHEEFEFLSA